MRAQIIKTVYIEVARRLNAQTDGPECYTGNSYRIDLIAEGPISEAVGWVVDYADLKSLFEPVYSMLDHHCLSDLPGLECDSSPEALEVWINRQLFPRPSWFSGVRVYPVEPGGFHLQRLEADIRAGLPDRYSFAFSAAQSLPQLPAGHPCRELHGHTYQLELACRNKAAMPSVGNALYTRLNGQYLNRLPGLEQATAERIAVWVWDYLETNGAEPIVVGVQETSNNRCYYFGRQAAE
ncbi:MAG TPA: 6-carboxytetrahydropterin synthase [Candidatus Hydrogenedentes bacterium]|nr:6-carboxytetrahydropterin synthase [Candidatus Hydrogenedentota bacterium]